VEGAADRFTLELILKVTCVLNFEFCLGTHSFVKVPRPADSEGTFSVIKSSCHLLLPV